MRSRKRWSAWPAALVFVALGCSASDPNEAFCDDARSFVEFQDELRVAVFVPEETEAFFTESVSRISDLAEAAPPTVARDLATLRDGFVELDRDLAAVGYDVTRVPDAALDTSDTDSASDRIEEFLATACRRDGEPFSGFADDPLAPPVLDPDEMAELEGGGDVDDEQLRGVLSGQLADELGLDPTTADCVVDEVGVSFLASLTAGAEVTDADAERFGRALDACGAG